MSLRLLQKNAAAGEARGRGRGRQQRTISLQQFQHESAAVPARTGTTGSVWGRGSGAANSTPGSASAAPTLQEARGRGGRGPSAPEPRQSAWQRGAPQSAVDALWDAPAAAPAVSDEASWDLSPHIAEEPDIDQSASTPAWEVAPHAAAPNWDASSPGANGADSGVGHGAQPEDEDISSEVIAWLTELKLDKHREAVLAWCSEMGAASLDEVVESIDELISSVEFTSLQTKRIQKNALEALDTVKAKYGSASAQLVTPLVTPVTSAAELLAADDRCPGGGSFYTGKGGSMRGRGVRATTKGMAGATPSASSSCSSRGRARGRGGGMVEESSAQSFYGGDSCPKDDCQSEDAGLDGSQGAQAVGFYASGCGGGFYTKCSTARSEEQSRDTGGVAGSFGNLLEEYDEDEDEQEGSNADGSRGCFYKGGGGSFYADKSTEGIQEEDEEALSKGDGFHTRGIVKALAERELVTHYRKENTTEKGTWEPAKKVSQGARKKNLVKTSPDSKQACPEAAGAGDGREAARQLFEQQLKASEDFTQALEQRDGRRIRQLLAEGLLGKLEVEAGQALLVELASENLASAIQSRDEGTVQALLAEERLNSSDVAAGKNFLAEEASRRYRRDQVHATLSSLRRGDNCDELRRSITEARGLLDLSELQEAEDDLQRMLERRHQRCIDAVAMLRGAVQAPRDAGFGAVARQAFQGETFARLVDGGVEAIDDLQVALDEWEKKQLAHKEARMVLALAKRRNNPEALQIAIDEAREAGLPHEDELMCEALEELDKIHREHRAVKETADQLQQALQASDPLELERAIEACARLRLPVGDARERLAQMMDEERWRCAAAGSLRATMEAAESPEAMKAALKEAREAGVEDTVLKEAEAQISALEVASKRRENASVELFLARQARSSQRLKAAIVEAQRVGADTAEILKAASAELLEVQKEEQRQDQASEMLSQAIANHDLDDIRAALQASEGILPYASPALAEARAFAEKLEEAARLEEVSATKNLAKVELQCAIEQSDFRAIQAGRHRCLQLGCPEDAEVILSAASKMESLRDEHEVEEARQLVDIREARIQELSQREAQLVGPSNKKERAAIGKEILGLKDDPAYISAIRFLRNPEEERKCRAHNRLENERHEAEEAHRLQQRRDLGPQELSEAFNDRDEDLVRKLLCEEILSAAEVASAEAWLAEQAERSASARKDASILEFSYAGLQKREFFKAPVAMNDFFTEKYSMREGSDFKLKVVTSCSSVLVAFRSPEIAEAILRTAQSLVQTLPSGNQASVVASAEVRGPLDFGTEVEGSLPECRQDADKLQREGERPQTTKAIQNVTQLILAHSSGVAGVTALPPAGEKDAEGFVSVGKGGRTLPMVTRAETTGFSCYSGKGKASFHRAATTDLGPPIGSPCKVDLGKGKAELRRAQTTAFSSGPGYYAGKGKASNRGGNLACNPPQTVPLPKEAAVALRHDWAKAELFHKDLEMFASKNSIVATCDGHTEIVLRPTGSLQLEEWESVRAELQGLISHHFPQERRRSRLRVSDDRGAGIELNWVEDGYQVDAIEEYPGQEFSAGEVIVEINGVSLVGLTEEEMEDTFSEHFVNGASLALIRYDG